MSFVQYLRTASPAWLLRCTSNSRKMSYFQRIHRPVWFCEFGHVLAFSYEMMTDEKDWRKLCAMVAEESNPQRLSELIDQLIKALHVRRHELQKNARAAPGSGTTGDD